MSDRVRGGEKYASAAHAARRRGAAAVASGGERSRVRAGVESRMAEVPKYRLSPWQQHTMTRLTSSPKQRQQPATTRRTPPPPPQLTGVSARQQGMLVKMFAKATGMVGFDVGALYVEDYGYVTVFQSGWLAAAAVNGDLGELGGNQPWRGVHERGHGPGDG